MSNEDPNQPPAEQPPADPPAQPGEQPAEQPPADPPIEDNGLEWQGSGWGPKFRPAEDANGAD